MIFKSLNNKMIPSRAGFKKGGDVYGEARFHSSVQCRGKLSEYKHSDTNMEFTNDHVQVNGGLQVSGDVHIVGILAAGNVSPTNYYPTNAAFTQITTPRIIGQPDAHGTTVSIDNNLQADQILTNNYNTHNGTPMIITTNTDMDIQLDAVFHKSVQLITGLTVPSITSAGATTTFSKSVHINNDL